MIEMVIETEYPPLFPDVVPHSYLDARREYAPQCCRRSYDVCYHPACLETVIADRCRMAEVPTSKEEIHTWVHAPMFGDYGEQFRRVRDAGALLACRKDLPPWCQYCMLPFDRPTW